MQVARARRTRVMKKEDGRMGIIFDDLEVEEERPD